MKKRNVLPLLLFSTLTFGLLVSCAPTQDPTVNQITGVEIGGASSVSVGKTIRLVADVLGSDDDSVIWSSSDDTIATINSNGTLTGLSEGEVTITAKSAAKPEYFGTKVISVTLERGDKISIHTEENDYCQKITNSLYKLKLGVQTVITVDIDPIGSRQPDEISFELIIPSEYTTTAFELIQDPVEPNKAYFKSLVETDSVTVKAKANYSGNTTSPMLASITFDIVDTEAEDRITVSELNSVLKSHEKDNLNEFNIESTYKLNDVVQKERTIHSSIYKNSSYTVDTANNVSRYYYSGVPYLGIESNPNYYAFEYDKDGNIVDIFYNEVLTDLNDKYYYGAYLSGEKLEFGFTSRIISLLENSAEPEDFIVPLYDTYAYINSSYEIQDNLYIVTSNFTNPDTNCHYDIKLEVEYNKNTKEIIKYTFEETSTIYDDVYYYQENGYPSYNLKNEDNNSTNDSHINFEKYFLKSFDLVNCNETTEYYDYSNKDKYGPEKVETLSDGTTKYYVNKNKTLILKVINTEENSKASLYIDSVKSYTSNANVVPAPVLTGVDIFAINPYSDPATDEITLGEATLTFVSKNGITKKVVIEFIDVKLSKIYTSNVPEDNNFGEIFKGTNSDYFYINTEPDEDKYEYEINIISGNEKGISIIRNSYDNPFGIPGFSYSIVGNEIGEYSFRIRVKDTNIETFDVYTIKVVEPYSVEYLEEELVTKAPSFEYSTGTMTATINFKNTTKLELSINLLGNDPVSQELSYKLEEGKILIENQIKLNDGMYFTYISKGEIYFNKEFTKLTILFSVSEDENALHYAPYEFNKAIDINDIPAYVEGKEYQSEVFILNQGYLPVKLTFGKFNGEFTLFDGNSNILFKVTFNFTYDTIATSLYLNNINEVTSSDSYSLDDEIYFHSGYRRLEVKFYTSSYDYEKIYFEM